MKAKVKLLMVPTIQISIGSEEDGVFQPEEQYLITKSGWNGVVNVAHEDAPMDDTNFFTKPVEWLGNILGKAAKDGAPHTTVVEQIRLIQEFRSLASQNINDKYEMSLDEDDVNETADRDRPVMKEGCGNCGPACICDAISDCKSITKGDEDEG